MDFKNRADQIRRDMIPRFQRKLKKAGFPQIPKEALDILEDLCESCAMVGACEERSRAIEITKSSADGDNKVDVNRFYSVVTNRGILEVLGYKEG